MQSYRNQNAAAEAFTTEIHLQRRLRQDDMHYFYMDDRSTITPMTPLRVYLRLPVCAVASTMYANALQSEMQTRLSSRLRLHRDCG